MLFTFEKAVEVMKHYKDIFVGTPLNTDTPDYKISGLFFCHKGNVKEAIDTMIAVNFDEKSHYLKIIEDAGKDFEVYVYHDNGADIIYRDLDINLSEKGITKIW